MDQNVNPGRKPEPTNADEAHGGSRGGDPAGFIGNPIEERP